MLQWCVSATENICYYYYLPVQLQSTTTTTCLFDWPVYCAFGPCCGLSAGCLSNCRHPPRR